MRAAGVALAAAAMLASGLTACSSDDSSSNSTGPTVELPDNPAKGSAIKIGFITPEGGATSLPEVRQAAEAATTHIAAGADILTGSAQMVVGAIGKAEESGLYWFGTQADQNSFAPKTVVASQVYHWENILREIISLRAAGTLGGHTFTASLQNGGQVITFNPEVTISDEIKTKVEETIAGINDGSIVIPKP